MENVCYLTELLVERQWYYSVMGYTWLFFSAHWSNRESQKWQVSIGIDLVVLHLLFFWSDINSCCVCMRLMFYNKYIFETVISDEPSADTFQCQAHLMLARGFPLTVNF
jgi:hypothetical protein